MCKTAYDRLVRTNNSANRHTTSPRMVGFPDACEDHPELIDMAATRMTPRGWVLSLLTVALVASAAGRPYASDTNPTLDSLKSIEQKTVTLVPPLVEATV